MVEYITYKEQKYPIRIGYYVLKMLQAETGKNIEDVTDDITLYEKILYYGMVQGAKVTGKEFNLKEEDMVDVLDECLFDFIKIVPKFFPNMGGNNDVKKKK